MKQDGLKSLLDKDFNEIFDDLELFVECIPQLVKLVGQVDFLNHMGFSYYQFNRRLNDRNRWNIDELRKAKDFFVDYRLGKSG